MRNYRARVVDSMLVDKLEAKGAVVVNLPHLRGGGF